MTILQQNTAKIPFRLRMAAARGDHVSCCGEAPRAIAAAPNHSPR